MFKKEIITLTILFFTAANAQKSIVVSGGKATGSNGSVAFSVGQISYRNLSGIKTTNGVQQPYEILVLGNDNFEEISLQMKVFPNPTTNNLSLIIAVDFEKCFYNLYDIDGRFISKYQKITTSETLISLVNNPSGIYFLEVISENKKLKTFKIIKN
jgi:hypothetical protein